MNTVPHIIVIEALSSGTGLRIVEAALRRATAVTFVTDNRHRYRTDPGHGLLDKCRVVDNFPTGDVAALTDFLRAEVPDAAGATPTVISLVDRVVEAVAAACDRVGLPFAPVSAVRTVQDKTAFRRLCDRIGVPAPQSVDVRDADAAVDAARAIGLPVVLKPARGTGSYGVSACYELADVPAAFARAWRDARSHDVPVQVEELAVGPLVSVELLATTDGMRILGFTDRVLSQYPDFVELAGAFPTTVNPVDTDALRDCCRRLVEALGYVRAPAHVEFALTAKGPMAIEFNPRLAGRNFGPMMEAALNWDLYGALIDLAVTGSCAPPPVPVAAAAEHAVYAKHVGVLTGVAGQDVARRVCGVQEVRLCAVAGQRISGTGDQRAEVAITWAVGANAGEAAARARTAAAALHPIIEPHHPSAESALGEPIPRR